MVGSIQILASVLAAVTQVALAVGLACHACADEPPSVSTVTSSATSLGAPPPADGEAATTALAITRRDSEDGTRIVQVIEDDRMIRISQRPGKGIVVIVVETLRDDEKVQRYAAPNAKTLESRHPRGYALYQRYFDSEPVLPTAEALSTTAMGQTQKKMRQQLEAQYQAQLRQMRRQMQQQMMQQQGLSQQRGAMQRAGAGSRVSRGGWARASARASANASAQSSSSSSSSRRVSGNRQ